MRVGVNIACDVTILAGIGDGSVKTLKILEAFAKLAKCKNCKHSEVQTDAKGVICNKLMCRKDSDNVCKHFSYNPKKAVQK